MDDNHIFVSLQFKETPLPFGGEKLEGIAKLSEVSNELSYVEFSIEPVVSFDSVPLIPFKSTPFYPLLHLHLKAEKEAGFARFWYRSPAFETLLGLIKHLAIWFVSVWVLLFV